MVPCYRTETLLPRCLESLLAQTLDGMEVIAVDDGSPDGTLALLRRYEAANPGVIRVVSKENAGLWLARWSGTDVARGAYVTYVDSDDYVAPDFARDLYETAVREDADIAVCGFSRIEEGTGRVLSTEMGAPRAPISVTEDPGLLVQINSAAWNKCYRRELLMRMDRLADPPAILEDVMLTQLAYLAARRPVAFTGTAPYRYMVREGSMINTVTVAQVDTVRASLLEVRDAFVRAGASRALLESLDATAFLHLGVSMSFRLSNAPGVRLSQEMARTTAYLDEHFPTWRRSPYISLGYARKNGGAYIRLLVAQWAWRAHLMRPLLAAYDALVRHLGRDIKW